MQDLDRRLTRCFASVFPTLSAGQIPEASTEMVAAWDSLAAVTLAAVLEEEFGVPIDPLDLPELNSYAAAKAYLENR